VTPDAIAIVQPLEGDVARPALDPGAAERTRDDGAAGAQRQRLEEARATHDREHHDRREEQRPRGRTAFARGAQQDEDDGVDRDDDERDGDEKREQEPARRAPRGFLSGEEVHVR
jgi:hypothetical protein